MCLKEERTYNSWRVTAKNASRVCQHLCPERSSRMKFSQISIKMASLDTNFFAILFRIALKYGRKTMSNVFNYPPKQLGIDKNWEIFFFTRSQSKYLKMHKMQLKVVLCYDSSWIN